MHNNANILCQLLESDAIAATCLMLQPKESGGGGGLTPDEMVTELATKFEEMCPAPMRKDEAGENLTFFQGQHPDSLTNFLMQEVERFNKLTKIILTSLSNIKKAIKGLVLMSPALLTLF